MSPGLEGWERPSKVLRLGRPGSYRTIILPKFGLKKLWDTGKFQSSFCTVVILKGRVALLYEKPCVSGPHVYNWIGLRWSQAINWSREFPPHTQLMGQLWVSGTYTGKKKLRSLKRLMLMLWCCDFAKKESHGKKIRMSNSYNVRITCALIGWKQLFSSENKNMSLYVLKAIKHIYHWMTFFSSCFINVHCL